MKYLVLLLTCLLLSTAQATLITDTHDISASGEGSVGYTYFEVITAGDFDIYTMGPTIDPTIFLFVVDGLLDQNDKITSDDDSCPESLCGSAGAYKNSLIDNKFPLAS